MVAPGYSPGSRYGGDIFAAFCRNNKYKAFYVFFVFFKCFLLLFFFRGLKANLTSLYEKAWLTELYIAQLFMRGQGLILKGAFLRIRFAFLL